MADDVLEELMDGWDWGSLLLPIVEQELPEGYDTKPILEKANEQLAPLTAQINELLAERAEKATVEQRLLVVERKLAALRQAHEIMLALVFHYAREGFKGRAGSADLVPGRAGRSRAAKQDEAAKRRARRLTMLDR
jgi:hypothetical protein